MTPCVGTRQSFAIPFRPISSIERGNIAVADQKPAGMFINKRHAFMAH
jgi:hypothetical protein